LDACFVVGGREYDDPKRVGSRQTLRIQQQFCPKEQNLACFTAQTNPAVTPQTKPASRPLKVVNQPAAVR